MDLVGTAVDTAGVAVMVFGATVATGRFLFNKQGRTLNAYRLCRQDRTVVDPALDNVIVLGLIVLIRTFLSLALQLEVEGRWPWQHGNNTEAGHGEPRSLQ